MPLPPPPAARAVASPMLTSHGSGCCTAGLLQAHEHLLAHLRLRPRREHRHCPAAGIRLQRHVRRCARLAVWDARGQRTHVLLCVHTCRLAGTIRGDTYVPHIFAASQRRAAEAFFRANHYLDHRRARDLQVTPARGHARGAGALCGGTCVQRLTSPPAPVCFSSSVMQPRSCGPRSPTAYPWPAASSTHRLCRVSRVVSRSACSPRCVQDGCHSARPRRTSVHLAEPCCRAWCWQTFVDLSLAIQFPHTPDDVDMLLAKCPLVGGEWVYGAPMKPGSTTEAQSMRRA